MDAVTSSTRPQATHYLMFAGLFLTPRTVCFPCDAQGHVHLDGLTPRALDNYLFARSTIGRDYEVPVVVPSYVSSTAAVGAASPPAPWPRQPRTEVRRNPPTMSRGASPFFANSSP